MSIQITDQICAVFSQGDWRRGIKLLCSERKAKAQNALAEISPNDSTGVAKLQEEIRQLDKLSCVEDSVLKFEEKQALQKLVK